MMAENSLENYYQVIFSLVNHYHYGITEVENIYPFERDIFVKLLQDHINRTR